MNRGEIWTVIGGFHTAKPLEAPLLRLPVPYAAVAGLQLNSPVMIDKITTVRRSDVSQRSPAS